MIYSYSGKTDPYQIFLQVRVVAKTRGQCHLKTAKLLVTSHVCEMSRADRDYRFCSLSGRPRQYESLSGIIARQRCT